MERSCKCVSPGMCSWHGVAVDQQAIQSCTRGEAPQGQLACMHLRDYLGNDTWKCSVHGQCQLTQIQPNKPTCLDCSQFVAIEASPKEIRKKWVDSLGITTSHNKPTDSLRGLLKGRGAFLVLGGPSAKSLPLERLQERGIFSMGVNNVAASVRVNSFVCADPPSKFHNGIWTDPSVMKFIPNVKLRKKLGAIREKMPNGEFRETGQFVMDCPNVWGFRRRSWLSPDISWFLDDEAAWGNHNKGCVRTGEPKTAGTILLALRLLQYLEARVVFLVGCDFWMNPIAGLTENYAFAENRNADAVRSNNDQYKILNNWLVQLRPVFEHFGFFTFNCYQHSRLSAFDYVPFDTALEIVRGNCPIEPYDCRRWYEK